MTTLNPIEKLTSLSAQRTVRTDRLHNAVRDLLSQLDGSGVELGALATVDGWTLSRREIRSNVGSRDCWDWGHARDSDEYSGCTDLSLAVGHEGYLHGDFHAYINGPTRAHLLAFATRAQRIVDALVTRATAEVAALAAALASIPTEAE